MVYKLNIKYQKFISEKISEKYPKNIRKYPKISEKYPKIFENIIKKII